MNRPAAQARSRVPRIAGAAVERARLTVVPRTRAVRAARVPFVLFVSLILLLGVVGLLMFNTSMQQATFTLDTYQERAVSLAAREEQLTAELEELRDPQTLAEKAQRAGMVPATCAPTLRLADGSVSGADVCASTPGAPLDLSPDAPAVPDVYTRTTIVEVPATDTGAPSGETGKRDGRKKPKHQNRDNGNR
jgi:cell division protein FtsB